MSPHVVRRWCWLLAFLPAFACTTRDLRTVISEYRPKVEPQLTKLEKIRDAARTAPPVTNDLVQVNGPPPKMGLTDVDGHVNASIEYLEDLDDFSAFGNVPFRILGSGSLNRCAAIFKTHRYPYDPIADVVPKEIPFYVAEEYLKHCANVRYVFVIRSLAYAPPSSVRDYDGPCPGSSPENDETTPALPDKPAPPVGATDANKTGEKCRVYVGGYLSAEVLVFDMTTVSQVGGFRYTAESSPKVDLAAYSDRDIAMLSDFGLRSRTAFQQAAQNYVPSFGTGY